MIRIILADDHAVLRQGLRLVLERHHDLEIVGEAHDGRGAVEMAERLTPDIALLDITMPNLNGIEAASQITSRVTGVAVIILSMHKDESFVLRALKSGARGYVLKESGEADLVNAVRFVSEGKSYFSPSVSRMLVEDYVRQLRNRDIEDSFDLLTAREREVLQLIAEGKANKDIACILNLSLYTIETHRSNVLAKLNLHSVAELVLYAVRRGVIC